LQGRRWPAILVPEISQSIINRKLMRQKIQTDNEFSVGNTVIKLAFVSGALLSCIYGVLMVFASAFKVLG
jgi:hypothetical protein